MMIARILYDDGLNIISLQLVYCILTLSSIFINYFQYFNNEVT